MKTKPAITPKFEIGQKVKEKPRMQTVGAGKSQKRREGVIISIVIKKNKRGDRSFYYDVFWGSGVTSQHGQTRLALMDD